MDHRAHSAYSDPGRHSGLVDALDPSPEALSQLCRRLIGHYRAHEDELPRETIGDIHSRWLDVILDRAVERQAGPLDAERAPSDRVQGCCRDHALLAVGVLRHHMVPARSRVGFTNYFDPTWHHDHVVPEYHDGTRWIRFEPMLDVGDLVPDPLDLRQDVDPATDIGFATAAQVWLAHRDHGLDLSTFGVAKEAPEVGGVWFVREYVIFEVAHRYGDELLLWESWGAMEGPNASSDTDDLVDRVARLLVAADAGDEAAEAELDQLYRTDDRLHPGSEVFRIDPTGGPAVTESLVRP
ncbi:transglutaminase-like domain-containing protein [Aestuariimicrobium ganziense]|uniref:transglutaminase-like domain-containing protein n=1 Tax=Aestuariimicrobium ganziense TaxID=2773677 RepID=UPI00194599D5|nr:transglutaminase-like domain-containing protein [Aestuariimicrobium ganziense]